ncbi:hypothetical protein Anas_04784 [Armadillidium nasatum]|uniref:Uncharacterized protein n=1 Tax=Armadillidium nasatum TaxID=96803 RepID=A0A5N5SRR9_9CRUS|nr:hypothetical protein Anas_04784 [Armadillidium nasatum]
MSLLFSLFRENESDEEDHEGGEIEVEAEGSTSVIESAHSDSEFSTPPLSPAIAKLKDLFPSKHEKTPSKYTVNKISELFSLLEIWSVTSFYVSSKDAKKYSMSREEKEHPSKEDEDEDEEEEERREENEESPDSVFEEKQDDDDSKEEKEEKEEKEKDQEKDEEIQDGEIQDETHSDDNDNPKKQDDPPSSEEGSEASTASPSNTINSKTGSLFRFTYNDKKSSTSSSPARKKKKSRLEILRGTKQRMLGMRGQGSGDKNKPFIVESPPTDNEIKEDTDIDISSPKKGILKRRNSFSMGSLDQVGRGPEESYSTVTVVDTKLRNAIDKVRKLKQGTASSMEFKLSQISLFKSKKKDVKKREFDMTDEEREVWELRELSKEVRAAIEGQYVGKNSSSQASIREKHAAAASQAQRQSSVATSPQQLGAVNPIPSLDPEAGTLFRRSVSSSQLTSYTNGFGTR